MLDQIACSLAANVTSFATGCGLAWLVAFSRGLDRLAELESTAWRRAIPTGLAILYVFLLAPAAIMLGSSAELATIRSGGRVTAIVLLSFAVPLEAALAWILVCVLPREALPGYRAPPAGRQRWLAAVTLSLLALAPASLAVWTWLAVAEYDRLLRL